MEKSWPNLWPIKSGGFKPPLFWVHGDASDTFLADYLDTNRPLYGFKHQSRYGEKALYTEVETIADFYLAQALQVQSEGPYFLGGHSFGGTIAFEMAQQLHRKGQTVALLFMIDSLGPGLPLEIGSQVSAAAPSHLEVQRHLRILFRLKPREKLNYVFIRLKGKTTAHLEKLKVKTTIATKHLKNTLIKIHLFLGLRLPRSLRGQYIWTVIGAALAKYTPMPYPGRAIYVKSEERDLEHVARWSRVILGGLEVHKVANSSHRDIVGELHGRFWAEKLKACLIEAQQRAKLGALCLQQSHQLRKT